MEWQPEHDVDPGFARELIAAQFPELPREPVERYGAGMDNIAYLIATRYVFRFPRRAIAAQLLHAENRALPHIAPRVPLPVPVPRFIGEPRNGYPWPFAGYERVPGTSLCSTSITAEQRCAIGAPLGRFLRALHAIDPESVPGGLPLDPIGRYERAKNVALSRDRFRALTQSGAIDDPAPLLRVIEEAPLDAIGAPDTVVHGDLYARHLLLDDRKQLCGVIDWGDVHLGHRATDLMAAHAVLPPEAHAAFLKAYGPVDDVTWQLARYRAVYHAAPAALFAMRIGDGALREAALTALRYTTAAP